jgi:ParB family chromosome partitioning protein
MGIEESGRLPEAGSPGRAVHSVPIGSIITNPFQPRQVFDNATLQELSQSIKEFGILQPLLAVPLDGGQYLLIAGERRLRAAYLAGLTSVPVIAGNYSSQEVAEIAMIENLQREDLHFLDEAAGYDLMMREFGITQENLARRIGKKQSTVANKLRILKLGDGVLALLRKSALTERHARALLRLEGEGQRLSVAQAAIDNELNVRQTEELAESVLAKKDAPPPVAEPGGKRTRVIRDVRIFLNTIKKVAGDIKKAGLKVKMEQQTNAEEVIVTLRIPLAADKAKGGKRSLKNGKASSAAVSHETMSENAP